MTNSKIDWGQWLKSKPVIALKDQPNRITLSRGKRGTFSIGISGQLAKSLGWGSATKLQIFEAKKADQLLIRDHKTGDFACREVGQGSDKGLAVMGFEPKTIPDGRTGKAFCEFEIVEDGSKHLVVRLPLWAVTETTEEKKTAGRANVEVPQFT